MWDIESRYLQKDEQIEYTDKPSMLSCIIAYIWVGLLMLSFLGSLIGVCSSNDSEMKGFSYIWMWFFLFLLASPALYIILKRLSTRYAISNKGLLQRVGIITTSIKSVPFKHITSTEVKESIAGKIFGYAHLIIDTSGSGKAIELNWDYLKDAHSVKKIVEEHIGHS